MVRVYSSPLLTIVENVKNVLEANGIPSNITNQYLSTAVGEIPPIESWPQLWVAEEDADRASEIIKAQTSDKGGSWVCPGCSEEIEPQFTECWNCGMTRK